MASTADLFELLQSQYTVFSNIQIFSFRKEERFLISMKTIPESFFVLANECFNNGKMGEFNCQLQSVH